MKELVKTNNIRCVCTAKTTGNIFVHRPRHIYVNISKICVKRRREVTKYALKVLCGQKLMTVLLCVNTLSDKKMLKHANIRIYDSHLLLVVIIMRANLFPFSEVSFCPNLCSRLLFFHRPKVWEGGDTRMG